MITNTYLDVYQYQQQPTGLTATLPNYIGNQFRFTTQQPAGRSFLFVTSSNVTVQLNQFDNIYIFDGPNSEVVQVGAGGAAPGATTIPLQGVTTYTHNPGVAVCSDGTYGSLGAQIFQASRWLEDICYQPLYSTAYTGEILTMPTMRAALDNQNNLHFRPRHFPVTALTSITIEQTNQTVVTLDPTLAIIDADQQTIDIPQIDTTTITPPGGNSQVYFWQPWSRSMNAWLTLSYTAGYAQTALPWAVTRAATLLTSEMFVQLENPIGGTDINQGKRHVTFMIRGDTTGDTMLVKQAVKLLSPYISQQF